MGCSAIGGSTGASVTLRQIDNGYQVTKNSETKKLSADGNNFLYDYENLTFAFSTLEEAVAKVAELAA